MTFFNRNQNHQKILKKNTSSYFLERKKSVCLTIIIFHRKLKGNYVGKQHPENSSAKKWKIYHRIQQKFTDVHFIYTYLEIFLSFDTFVVVAKC